MAVTSRRARVMARSQRLGRCICDPRQPCPCDLLLTHDVCRCAGERLERQPERGEPIRLTRLVKSPGCASKIPPGDLARVLERLPAVTDQRLLVGSATGDDAGVFQVSAELCLVQTVDVFTPCVDDPYHFGRIAACNSLSDVYAMGGKPVTALSIIGYPAGGLGEEAVSEMLRGGMEQLAEAGVVLVGGHSINDEEVKLGFAITGVVTPSELVTNAGAQVGDLLILTKPLGVGIIGLAAQLGHASAGALAAAQHCMLSSNRTASEIMVSAGAHACTDVTGFGLLGHLRHITRESAVAAEVWWEELPLLPEVSTYASQGLVPGAVERNRDYVADSLAVAEGVPEHALDVLCDPQTSGGLLIAASSAAAAQCLAELHAGGYPQAAVIGRVREGTPGQMTVTERCTMSTSPPQDHRVDQCCPTSASEPECCTESAAPEAKRNGAPQAFQQFMAAAFRPGALDAVQKELMTIALSVAVQCEPCLKTHLEKAASMGITRQEIEEAAWMGVAFGGCKAMMFWTGWQPARETSA